MQDLRPLLACTALALLLAACQGAPRPRPTGFLGGAIAYDQLQPAADHDGVWSWRNRWNKEAGLSTAHVAPVEMWPMHASSLSEEDARAVHDLAEHFGTEMVRVTESYFPLSDAAGPGTMLLMAAVIGVDPTRPHANLARKTPGGPDGFPSAHVEIRMVDGGTGAHLGSLVALPRAPGPGATPPEPRAVLTRWAGLIGELLLSANPGNAPLSPRNRW